MTDREDIIRMAQEAGVTFVTDFGVASATPEWLARFATLVAAAKQEHMARQWDALHEQYMADPLRRQMMLSYEMVARMIRGNAK